MGQLSGDGQSAYAELIGSETFQSDLNALNAALCDVLRREGVDPILNGNLLYDHLQPEFWKGPLEPRAEPKRARMAKAARSGETLFEIGVNGGHSLLLAKSANSALRCIGLDVCRQVDPEWARVDLYVPVAMEWLQTRFPGDFRFIVGDSRLECPRFAVENPEERIDILHVDGAKETYFRDIVNLMPLLTRESMIIVDDSNMFIVKNCIRQLIRAGIAELHPDFPRMKAGLLQNTVLRPAPERIQRLRGLRRARRRARQELKKLKRFLPID